MSGITFNGKPTSIDGGLTLAVFLASQCQGSGNLIVELNGEILPNDDGFSQVLLNEGDTLNVFKIVSGG